MTTLEIPFDPARAERIAAARRTFPEQVVDRVAENLFRTDTVIDEVVADFATLGRGAGFGEFWTKPCAPATRTRPGPRTRCASC